MTSELTALKNRYFNTLCFFFSKGQILRMDTDGVGGGCEEVAGEKLGPVET